MIGDDKFDDFEGQTTGKDLYLLTTKLAVSLKQFLEVVILNGFQLYLEKQILIQITETIATNNNIHIWK